MNTFFNLILLALLASIMQSFNPVKVVFSIMATSIFLFLWQALISGNFWFPLIFFLLFMGGILIMFLILSSLLPNEKAWKMTIIPSVLIFLVFSAVYFFALKHGTTSEGFSLQGAKEIMTSGGMMLYMSALILLYFLVFVSMLSMDKAPLRLPLCC